MEPARADKFGAHAGSQEAPPAPPAFEAGDISKAVPGGADAAVVRMEPDSLTLQVRAQPPMPSTPPAAAAAAAAAAARVSKYGGGSRFGGGVWAAGLAAPSDAAAMLAPPIKKVLPPVTKGGPARTYKRHFWEVCPTIQTENFILKKETHLLNSSGAKSASPPEKKPHLKIRR